MAYTKTDWKNKIVEKPRTFILQQNADGSVTLNPQEGVVTEAGTPVNAANMNNIEQGIGDVDTSLTAHQADDVSHVKYGVATGTANTYAVSLNPAPTSYVEGMALSVKINVASTGASTINVNGLGAIPIKKANGSDATNLNANGIYTLRYDGTNFILQGEGGEYGTATANDVRSTKTFGTENGVIQGTLDLTNLIPTNIKKEVTVGGVLGTLTGVDKPIVGDSVITLIADQIQSSTTAVYVTKLEWQINLTGNYRVSFDLSSNSNYSAAYAQVFVNDNPVGIERTHNMQSSWLTFTEDFSLNAGDRLQIKLHGSGTGNIAIIRNTKVSIGNLFSYLTRTV